MLARGFYDVQRKLSHNECLEAAATPDDPNTNHHQMLSVQIINNSDQIDSREWNIFSTELRRKNNFSNSWLSIIENEVEVFLA